MTIQHMIFCRIYTYLPRLIVFGLKQNAIFATKFHKISDVIMILSAKFENIYSFNEETRILFTASKSDQLPLQVSRAEKRDDISVLCMGLIDGTNASGKSNIIKS